MPKKEKTGDISYPEQKIVVSPLEEEMEHSFLTYAMSVIIDRALPDVRDGLKPIHRRILYTMGEMGLHHDKPYRKCAGIVGEVWVNTIRTATVLFIWRWCVWRKAFLFVAR